MQIWETYNFSPISFGSCWLRLRGIVMCPQGQRELKGLGQAFEVGSGSISSTTCPPQHLQKLKTSQHGARNNPKALPCVDPSPLTPKQTNLLQAQYSNQNRDVLTYLQHNLLSKLVCTRLLPFVSVLFPPFKWKLG